MGGAVSAGEDNEELVDNLVGADYLKSPSVEKALRAVDRGRYYLEGARDTAYKDLAWKNGNLHISAPCIYSEVLECLEISPGMVFLNLGSGTGYLSTVVGLLLGGDGVNHGVEIHDSVVEYAKKRLEEFIECCSAIDLMGFTAPEFVVGNCLLLDPASFGSYDRVYCGAAVPEEQQSFIRSLIKVSGVAVMPCGDQLQKITRTGATSFDVKSVLPVSFATMVVPTAQELAHGQSLSLRKYGTFSSQLLLRLEDVRISTSNLIENNSFREVLQRAERKPQKLQEICRSKIRDCLRQMVYEELPEARLKSLLQDGRAPVEGSGEVPNSNDREHHCRRRRAVRRIVIPVLQSDSEEDDVQEHDDPVRRTTARRNIRRHIVAIRTTGASRDAMGQIQVEDLRWSPQFDSERGTENRKDDTESEHGSETEEEIEHENEEEMAIVDSPPGENNSVAADKQTASEDAHSLCCEPSLQEINGAQTQENSNEVLWSTEAETYDSNNEAEKADEEGEDENKVKRKPAGSPPSACMEMNVDEDSDSDDNAAYRKRREKRKLERDSLFEKQKIFSDRMKMKVHQLPLPAKLRDFLNYYRKH